MKLKLKMRKLKKEFLLEYNISNYRYEDNKLIVDQDVLWNSRGWKKIPFKIHKVNGNFSIMGNDLKNLKNFPDEISGYVDISFNVIESFKGICKTIEGKLLAENNDLKSFKYAPEIVKGTMYIQNNPIINIYGAPRSEPANGLSLHTFHDTKISNEHKEIYLNCCLHKTWNSKLSILDNLKKLVIKKPKYLEADWKLLKKLDKILRGFIATSRLNIS